MQRAVNHIIIVQKQTQKTQGAYINTIVIIVPNYIQKKIAPEHIDPLTSIGGKKCSRIQWCEIAGGAVGAVSVIKICLQ